MRPFLLVAVVALVASTLSWQSPDGRPTVVPVGEAPDTGSALLAARLQESRVEALDLRTPTRTVLANPDGTLPAELSVVPTRVKRGSSWVALDTTMAPRGWRQVDDYWEVYRVRP